MRITKGACITFCLILCSSLSGIAFAAERPQLGPGGNNYVPHSGDRGILVQDADLTQLLQCLLGPDVQVTNAVLTAAPGAAGLFTGGGGIIGIDQGLVLSSGNIVSLVGPNLLDDTSFDNGYPGDADLDALIPGYTTYDDFNCPNPTVISFQYVFASEEYNEWVGSPYNDVFGFFLNGVNIAQVPAGCSDLGIPVAINNVNCQNPYSPPSGPNCDCYRCNSIPDCASPFNTEMDGLTQVYYATAQIQPGTNHMKIAIADAGDHILDSNVMLHCQSYTCAPPPATGACCIEGECFLLGMDQCVSQGGVYQGDGVSCAPSPCAPSPNEEQNWGRIKSLYR
jgi:hypothetical protein